MKNIFGIINLDKSSDFDLKKIFFDEFSNVKNLKYSFVFDNIICYSEMVKENQNQIYAHRNNSIFWDTVKRKYIINNIEFINNPLNLIKLYENKVIQVSDSPSLLILKNKKKIRLIASTTGSKCFYYIIKNKFLIFADHVGMIKEAFKLDLNQQGIIEIIRFGANHGESTLLSGLKKIPFSHYLEIDGNKTELKCYKHYNYSPNNILSFDEVVLESEKAIDDTLSMSDDNPALLFSGGVDSIILASRLKDIGKKFSSYFYSMGDNDPEIQWAKNAADLLNIDLKIIESSLNIHDVDNSISSYSLPTLDFSTITTFDLGKQILNRHNHTQFIDGTGGDGYFGFSSINHRALWDFFYILNPILQSLASNIYSYLLKYENLKILKPIKLLSRMPFNKRSSLGHLTANPIYKNLLIKNSEWESSESEIIKLIDNIKGNKNYSCLSDVIISDVVMICIDCFAAKSGGWEFSSKTSTLYPYLMPNITDIGLSLKSNLLIKNGISKPVLKSIVEKKIVNQDFAQRDKIGFQPPLQKIFEDKQSMEKILEVFNRDDEISNIISDFAINLPSEILGKKNNLKITSLYSLWGIYSIKQWIDSLRNGKLRY